MCRSIYSLVHKHADFRSAAIEVRQQQVTTDAKDEMEVFTAWNIWFLQGALGHVLSGESQLKNLANRFLKGRCFWKPRREEISIIPCPSLAPVSASLALPNPSSRHTTVAARMSQLSSHTVPHSPFFNTSTRPSPIIAPPLSRTRGCWENSET